MDKTQEAKKLTHYDLLLFNRQGFLPLENESVESFLLRVANLQNSSDPHSCPKAKQAALQLCKQLFDVEPDWVSIIETQKELAFWQGAVMWVQTDHLGNDLPFIQISSRLNSALLRRWYSKEEVIAHELIHAIRLPLYSARFEEIIAYQTSHNPLRRFLGPLFRRPYEVYILLAALLGSWIGLFWDRFSFSC